MRTVERIKEELTLDLPGWMHQKEGLFYARPLEWLKACTPATDISHARLVASRFDRLSLWYMHAYAASALRGQLDSGLLALHARAGLPGFLFEVALQDAHPEIQREYAIDNFGLLLAGLITAGSKEAAELVARQGFKELNRLMDGGITPRRVPWLMLELAKDWLGAAVDLRSDFREHEVPNLGPWQKLLDGWRTPDMRALDALMGEMAELHLAQSDSPEDDESWAEFEPMAYWLFPVELLAVLRIREWTHLPTMRPSHPLFSATPLGQLHPPVAWPHDEVMDQAEARFRKIYPATPSVTDVMALREEQGSRETPVR